MKAYSQIDFYREYLKAQSNEDLVRSSFWAAKTLQQFPLHEVGLFNKFYLFFNFF